MKAEKILFTGIVVDDEDPFLLNRIRVFPDTDESIIQVLKSEFSESELKTTENGLDIIDTEKFMDLPMTAKAIYFLLGMEADDEGFVSSKKVLKRPMPNSMY